MSGDHPRTEAMIWVRGYRHTPEGGTHFVDRLLSLGGEGHFTVEADRDKANVGKGVSGPYPPCRKY